jgi:general secretion pathway protein B
VSFILDALKKSETDRQQQGSAECTGVPTSPGAPSVPRWLWVVGILLAINFTVLIGLLLKPDTVATSSAVPALTETSNSPIAETDSVPSFEEKVAAAQLNPPEQQTKELSVEQPDTATSSFVKPVLISQDPSAIPAAELYPSIQEVRASGTSNLPELHLDIHVYSSKPEDRFVFINMVKLHEGSQLKEGPQIEEITPVGVVLEHQGQLFLLSRD